MSSSSTWSRLRRWLPEIGLAAIAVVVAGRLLLGAHLTRAEGEPLAPSFSLRDARGGLHSLESLRGHPVLVNFWATWCPPCQMELPALQELSETHAGCLTVLGVAVDANDPAALGEFLAEHHITYPVWLDDGSVGSRYRVSTIPHSVLLDAGGHVMGTFDGPVTRRSVESALSDLLPQVC
jgi:thiol-disulfide isomerase/thioredoxin